MNNKNHFPRGTGEQKRKMWLSEILEIKKNMAGQDKNKIIAIICVKTGLTPDKVKSYLQIIEDAEL